MKKHLKKWVAVLLLVSLFAGLLPEDLGMLIATSRAAAAQAATVEAAGFSAYPELAEQLAEQGAALSFGGWRYVRIPETDFAAVIGYEGEAAARLDMPDLLDGLDVVAIAPNALSTMKTLEVLSVPGNVRAIGRGALPRGAAVRALHASFALDWAARNGHACIDASEYDFCTGVVDLSDVRPENFVRISAQEVWLRGLEASRLAVGKRFFLIDPANPYQISYYTAAAASERQDGFTVFTCETPSVDDVLNYIEGHNEQMMIDYSSLQLYEGFELNSAGNKRSLSGSASGEVGFKINLPKVI